MYCPHCGTQNEDHNRFCLNCGKTLPTTPGQTQPQLAYPLPRTAPMPGQSSWLKIAGYIGLALIAILGVVWISNHFSRRSSPLFYIIQTADDLDQYWPDQSIEALVQMDADGDNRTLLAQKNQFSDQTLNLPHASVFSNDSATFFSPQKDNFLLLESNFDDNSYQLSLFSIQKDIPPVFLGESAPGISIFGWQGFSSNGNLIAFTKPGDDDSIILSIHGKQGDTLLEIRNALFETFSPDEKHVIATIIDPSWETNVWEMKSTEISTGISTQIAQGEFSNEDNFLLFNPFFIPDDEAIYYLDQDNFIRLSTRDGSKSIIYQFHASDFWHQAYYAPEIQAFVIVDSQDEESETSVLQTFDPKTGNLTRINRDVIFEDYLEMLFSGVSAFPIIFSPDGKWVAYTKTEGETLNLYVSDTTGQNHYSITSSDKLLQYSFVPDKNQLVILELPSKSDEMGGDLFSANITRKELEKLDQNVWSFQLAPDGKAVFYFKVQPSGDDLQSTLYKVQLKDGSKERLAGPENGLCSFINLTE